MRRRAYPVLLYAGITIGIEVSLLMARSRGLATPAVLAALILLLVVALSGARLLYVLPRWRAYATDPLRVLRFQEGGAAMLGGLLLAVPASFAVLPALGLPVARFWDVATFTMLPALVVTRVGCVLRGCCAGRETSAWGGVLLANASGVCARRVPLQAMDAGCGVVLLGIAAWLWRQPVADGTVMLVVVALYGVGRVWMDGLREQRDRVGGVIVTPVLAFGLSVVSLAVLAQLAR
jgi:phosphatidylglycerol:prolipoprotein diacylglycerol transferase